MPASHMKVQALMTTTMCKQRDRCTRKLLSDGSVPRVLQTLTANALAQFGAGQDLVAYLQDIQYQRFRGSERWSSETQRAQTRKFIDFYCPPCFDVISTIEAVANAAYIKMLHIKPRIRISYLIPASCCPPVRFLDSLNSLNTYLRKEIRQSSEQSASSPDPSKYAFGAWLFDMTYLEQQIYELECMSKNKIRQLHFFSPNFLDTIMYKPDLFNLRDYESDRYLCADPEGASAASQAASCTILPPPRPFRPREIHQLGVMQNEETGETKGAWFYRGTWG